MNNQEFEKQCKMMGLVETRDRGLSKAFVHPIDPEGPVIRRNALPFTIAEGTIQASPPGGFYGGDYANAFDAWAAANGLPDDWTTQRVGDQAWPDKFYTKRKDAFIERMSTGCYRMRGPFGCREGILPGATIKEAFAYWQNGVRQPAKSPFDLANLMHNYYIPSFYGVRPFNILPYFGVDMAKLEPCAPFKAGDIIERIPNHGRYTGSSVQGGVVGNAYKVTECRESAGKGHGYFVNADPMDESKGLRKVAGEYVELFKLVPKEKPKEKPVYKNETLLSMTGRALGQARFGQDRFSFSKPETPVPPSRDEQIKRLETSVKDLRARNEELKAGNTRKFCELERDHNYLVKVHSKSVEESAKREHALRVELEQVRKAAIHEANRMNSENARLQRAVKAEQENREAAYKRGKDEAEKIGDKERNAYRFLNDPKQVPFLLYKAAQTPENMTIERLTMPGQEHNPFIRAVPKG